LWFIMSAKLHLVRLAVLAFAVLISAAAPCGAEWRRLDSPNFTIIGDVGARELRDLAVKFEGFRESLGRALGARATAAAVPTVIIVFPSDKAFSPFKPTYQDKPRADVRGFFVPGANINYILMESDGSERVVFHEYAHLIVSNTITNPPVWLNEGLAEFFSTFRLMDGKRAQIGLAIGEHLIALQANGRVPLPELLKVDQRSPLYNEAARASIFYAEAWALTHMILNGEPNRVAELSAYLRSVADGKPEARAWEETFGTERTEQDFRQYLTRNLFNTVVIEFPEKVAQLSATPTSLPPADVAAFLGAYLASHRQDDEAAVMLGQALKIDPANSRAAVAIAELEMRRREYGAAEKRLTGLGKTDDWLVAYSAAMAMSDLAGVGIAGSPNTELIQAARRQLDVVQRDRGEVPNVIAHRAALELAGPDPPTVEASASIARARTLAPGRYDYAFIEAQIFSRRGQFDAARAAIAPLMSGLYPPGVRDSARSLMGYVVAVEERRKAGALDDVSSFLAASGSKSIPVPGIDEPPRETGGSPKFVPSFRVVQAGEERVEGTLERIECAASGTATFGLSEGSSSGPFSARLSDVEFITYRDDLTGGVKCGAMPPLMRVYITWRTGVQPADDRKVVAVEFLPK
jgi:hypothetical protein